MANKLLKRGGELLTADERIKYVCIRPNMSEWELARYYTFLDQDIKIINRHRKNHNWLGFSVQLCTLLYPGWPFFEAPEILLSILQHIAQQECTRRKYMEERRQDYGYRHFPFRDYQSCSYNLLNCAQENENLEFMKEQAHHHSDDQHFVDEQAVCGSNVVTANGTTSLEFAKEILLSLKAKSETSVLEWYNLNYLRLFLDNNRTASSYVKGTLFVYKILISTLNRRVASEVPNITYLKYLIKKMSLMRGASFYIIKNHLSNHLKLEGLFGRCCYNSILSHDISFFILILNPA